MCNCGCLVLIHSNLIATSSPVEILVPKIIGCYTTIHKLYIHQLTQKSLFTVQTPDSMYLSKNLPKYISPKEPEPIFLPSLYLFPTRSSIPAQISDNLTEENQKQNHSSIQMSAILHQRRTNRQLDVKYRCEKIIFLNHQELLWINFN